MAYFPDASVGLLLNNLTEFIKNNEDSIGGAAENLAKLCTDLKNLKAFMGKHCSEKYNEYEFVVSLSEEITNVVYQAEDVIETYIVNFSRQKFRSSVAGRALHAMDHAMELRRLAERMEDVSLRIHDLYEKSTLLYEALKVEKQPLDAVSARKRIVVDEVVVGFEDEAEKVIQLLTSGTEQLEAISIIGMPGSGKTTLARKIYDDLRLEYKFSVRAFVSVSQNYKKNKLFLNILGACVRVTDEMQKMSSEALLTLINEHLKYEQYFIVLDDVWTTEAWEDLKAALPNNKKRSRVLITSREQTVAIRANGNIEPHYMSFLNNEECVELFRRKIFGKNECREEMEEHEMRILEKCKGLPLGIVVTAGILVDRQNEIQWWVRVADGGSLGHPFEHIGEIIELSFNSLPHALKPCFLYLGVFPEDLEIPVSTLLRLWLAEGFIPGDDPRISVEDLAETYLEELVERNLVMVGQRRANGQIKTCRVHDTLRDFCKMEAAKRGLFREIRRDIGNESFDQDRRLCIHSYVAEFIIGNRSAKNVRSFLSFPKQETTLPYEYISSVLKAFKLLRVMEIRSVKMSRFSPELFYLVLLRYIAISCDFQSLPAKMSNLRNLQTLIVRTSALNLDIKADIWKMGQLRHLDTNASTTLAEGKEQSITLINENLQTLSTISPESCKAEVLERTPRLKKLGIRGKLAPHFEANGESSLFDSLRKLESLVSLKLLNDDISYKLHAFPRENKFPTKLARLTLLNTMLDWRHMSTLGKLENLEVLKLKDNAFTGPLWETEEGGFRRLKVLCIGTTNLTVWKASDKSFPILASLFLRYCSRLEAIPPGFVTIPTLHTIDLYCTNSMVASSARKFQLAKLQELAKCPQEKNIKGFKLSVYPPHQ